MIRWPSGRLGAHFAAALVLCVILFVAAAYNWYLAVFR